MPFHRGPHILLHQPPHQIRTHDILPKPLLLQQLQVPERRARIRQVLEVGRPSPVLQVVEVSHEGGLGEELLGGNMVEVVGVREGLDELDEKGQYLARWEHLFVDDA